MITFSGNRVAGHGANFVFFAAAAISGTYSATTAAVVVRGLIVHEATFQPVHEAQHWPEHEATFQEVNE